MEITKEQKIRYINISELKSLQVIGSKKIIENDVVIADSEMAFVLVPTETISDRDEYKNLPASEKTKIFELSALWTDEVKADYEAHLAESAP